MSVDMWMLAIPLVSILVGGTALHLRIRNEMHDALVRNAKLEWKLEELSCDVRLDRERRAIEEARERREKERKPNEPTSPYRTPAHVCNCDECPRRERA